ncbi:MAG: hypothetical protein ABJ360_03385, partial [Roseobacter sp.]
MHSVSWGMISRCHGAVSSEDDTLYVSSPAWLLLTAPVERARGGLALEGMVFTFEMGVVVATLAFTIFLFVSEIIRIDLAAILILVLLGLLSYVPGLDTLADPT